MSMVFDTNILIYHLNGKLDEAAERMLEQALQENARISVITRIEVRMAESIRRGLPARQEPAGSVQ